ncbi:MAG: RagB/SusD family nutrient uptake outer membrane protein [Chitinophagaceae bacterium]
MTKMRVKILMLSVLAGVFVQSCKKQLDIPSRTSLDADLALRTKSGIDASLNSVYSVLKSERQYGRDMFSVPDAMADIAFANGRSSRLLGENRNQSLSNMANWSSSYGAINEINLTLAAIPAVGDATDADKLRWEGEFKFLRALYYFDLVKNYAYIPTFTVPSQDKGGVVLTLQGFNSAAAAAEFRPSRAATADVYNQIMSDLYAAVGLLSNANKGRNYASKHAALALGSRVALYQGNWQRADSFATAAITLTGGIGTMTTTANYITGWRAADHPEGIFQVWYATLGENLGVNTSLAATHTTLAAPGTSTGVRTGQGDLVPNGFLLSQLGITGYPAALSASPPPPALTYSSDVRNKLFEWGVNASGHYVECTKWLGKNGSANWDNTVVLRWPELYLNRAEARYHLSNEVGANADLTTIYTARIVGYTPGAPLAGQPLLDEILRQRMLEFAFEGHRFFDLKRYGLTITKSNPVVSLPANDFRLLPRIPVGEVDGNPNMVQNFGY